MNVSKEHLAKDFEDFFRLEMPHLLNLSPSKQVASELISSGWPVRILARHIPSFEKRIPGAEYTVADMGDEISHEIVKGVETVVHCAAETAGGKEAHERNSVNATRNIISSVAEVGIKKFINISIYIRIVEFPGFRY